MSRPAPVRNWAVLIAAALLLSACGGEQPPPRQPAGAALSISAPQSGQTLSGTIAVGAVGVGGAASDLSFELGGLRVDAAPDGTAVINTRGLADGDHTLTASGTVDNRAVQHSISVHVVNDLPSSGALGADGGSLKSPAGAYATFLPGAVGPGTTVTVDDLSQEQILQDYGVDYSALGLTFLGALDVQSSEPEFARPLQVDLSGWGQAVQPGQQPVMFGLTADIDGDGIGELMAVADAQTTPDGSVITRPQPRSEVYAPGAAASGLAASQQQGAIRPGEIVTLSGRGYSTAGALSGAARFDNAVEVLIDVVNAEEVAFNPLQTITFVMPGLSAGTTRVTLHNRSTGFVSDELSIDVGPPGSGSQQAWTGLLEQVTTAAQSLAAGRPDVAATANRLLAALGQLESSTAGAMSANSGLVSAANLTTLGGIGPGSYSGAQRVLVRRHALLLDAVASSVDGAAGAAELARLLLLLDPTSVSAGSAAAAAHLRPQQDGFSFGEECTPKGPTSAGPVGAGSAPPGGSGCGSVGGGGPGPTALSPQQAGGSFGPVGSALVRVLRRGSNQSLSPFTSRTDANGYYYIPFIPVGEPFTVRAFDPATGRIATADGIGPATGKSVVMPLVFALPDSGPGAPTANFTITPLPSDDFSGTWNYSFDASASSDDDGVIVTYLWSFGGHIVEGGEEIAVVEKGFGRNDSYTVTLTVIDDEGKVGLATRQLVIDDLPGDYWAKAPELVTAASSGQPASEGHEIPNADVFSMRGSFAASADGRIAAFVSASGNLSVGTGNYNGAYVKDMQTGAVELMSAGDQGAWVRPWIALSSNGRFVAFSEGTLATTTQSDGAPDTVVVKDRVNGSETSYTPSGLGDTVAPVGIDDAGTALLMFTLQDTLEPDYYLVDLSSETPERLGLRIDGTTYAPVDVAQLSADGKFVAFQSRDDGLVDGDTNGDPDVFLYDVAAQETTRLSVTQSGTQGASASELGGVGADGRFTVFSSSAAAFGVVDELYQVFVKDSLTGALELVSANAAGDQADQSALVAAVSTDGRYAVYETSATNLVPPVGPGHAPWIAYFKLSYVADRQTGQVALVTIGANDVLPDDDYLTWHLISADGRYVFYSRTASNLLSGTIDLARHLYRVENPLWEQ